MTHLEALEKEAYRMSAKLKRFMNRRDNAEQVAELFMAKFQIERARHALRNASRWNRIVQQQRRVYSKVKINFCLALEKADPAYKEAFFRILSL